MVCVMTILANIINGRDHSWNYYPARRRVWSLGIFVVCAPHNYHVCTLIRAAALQAADANAIAYVTVIRERWDRPMGCMRSPSGFALPARIQNRKPGALSLRVTAWFVPFHPSTRPLASCFIHALRQLQNEMVSEADLYEKTFRWLIAYAVQIYLLTLLRGSE